MAPDKKKKTKFPRKAGNAVNIDPKTYKVLVEMAESEHRPIKTQLELIIEREYREFKIRNPPS